jgi:tetratricopeptide (TPR) repeat protein
MQAAVAHHRAGRVAEAEAGYRRVLTASPRHPGALHLAGLAAHGQGRSADAVELIGRAIAEHPGNPDFFNDRALALAALGRLAEAAQDYDRAVALAPGNLQVLANRGLVRRSLGRHAEALADYDRLVAARPDIADLHRTRGLILADLRRFADAVASHDAALALRPGDAAAHSDRAAALLGLGDPAAALAAADRALALDPSLAAAHGNRGTALSALGLPEEAIAAYDRVLALAPDNADALVSRAYCLLALGRWQQGWPAFEWRQRTPATRPTWRGESLAGRTLLLAAEEGFGDTIQFARYVPLVAARAAREGGAVLLSVPPPLFPLYRDAFPGVRVMAEGQAAAFDLQCGLLSLPLVFGTTPATVPPPPVLVPDPVRRARWRARLAHRPGPRVGLVWSGNPSQAHDVHRSTKLATLAPLADVPVSFVALQPQPADVPWLDNLGIEFADFADTAAAMAELDLVISVCTSPAHLAGTLGVPTWVMLWLGADWRWLRERDDSPWYPSAKLFRQPALGDWASVVARVRAALLEWLSQRGQSPMQPG